MKLAQEVEHVALFAATEAAPALARGEDRE
jgi:hypothetical protein